MRGTTWLRWLKIAWHITSLLLLPLLTFRLWRNLRFLRWAREQAAPIAVPYPKVSVLVPARNEAGTISACVHSLMNQDYLNIELIVLNDGSSDGTGEKLNNLAQRYPRLKVIHAQDDLPEGWNGKSYACQRLAERATGDWLLFTDADTEHTRQSIALGVAQARALEVALLSTFPYQITRSWSERILVSFIIDFLPLIGLDFAGIWRGTSASTAANGQYLLVRAMDYRALG
ncbi:MAG: glycosyltransferase family 2 protein, partial [Chloroflexota bacterium]